MQSAFSLFISQFELFLKKFEINPNSMPERSSKRKARRESITSSVDEPECSSMRTGNVPSISDKDFADLTGKIEKSVNKRIKDTETGQREILKMIENFVF